MLGLVKDRTLVALRSPPDSGCEVIVAQDERIQDAMRFDGKAGAYLGTLDGRDIPVMLDLNAVLQKHIAILAKSGSGKSYTVGVLIEEVLKKGAPILVIDPHGEYHTLKEPNDEQQDDLVRHHLKPESFIKNIVEYGSLQEGLSQLLLPDKFDAQEILHILPAKLTQSQQAIFYASMRDMDVITIDTLQAELAMQDGAGKWAIIAIIDYLKKLGIFSRTPTPLQRVIQPGIASILNLRGMDPDMQEIVVTKLLCDLFVARKQSRIPPFFLVVEEAHCFAPERSFSEAKSSRIMRTIASEGRKFGLGLCVVSQRPARIDKSVLSQCSTQVILRITNPGDVRAIMNSLETMTPETEGTLQGLPVGVAMVCGIAQMPVFCRIRPRQTRHGGEAARFVYEENKGGGEDEENREDREEFLGAVGSFQQNMLPLIKPKMSIKDIRLMHDTPVTIRTHLIPAYLVTCEEESTYTLLIERTQGRIITNIDEGTSAKLPDLMQLSPSQLDAFLLSLHHPISPAELMVKKGFDFMRAQDIIAQLAKAGYLEIDATSGMYIPHAALAVPPSTCRSHAKIEYAQIKADQIMDAVVEAKGIKETIGRLTNVLDMQECYIVWHEVSRDSQEQDHQEWKARSAEGVGGAHRGTV